MSRPHSTQRYFWSPAQRPDHENYRFDFRTDESGVILVMTALLLFLVVIFLAFEIDFARIGIAQVEQKRAASLGALSALSVYRDTAMENEQEGLRSRTREARNAALLAATEIIRNPANAPMFIERDSDKLKIVQGSPDTRYYPANAAGIVRFGKWYFREPAGGCRRQRRSLNHCPCRRGKWKGPCFQPLPRREDAEIASAVEVELYTPAESPVRYLFASVSGQAGVSVRARSTASLLDDSGILSSPRIVESVLVTEPVQEVESGTIGSPDDVQEDEIEAVLPVESPIPSNYVVTDSVLEAASKNSQNNECKPGKRLFRVPGEYSYAPPPGCSRVKFLVWGAGGSADSRNEKAKFSNGGSGGFVSGYFRSDAGGALRVIVGSGGVNRCSPGYKGPADFGGGGFKDLEIGSGGGYSGVFQEKEPLLVAGGGGAGGRVATEPCADSADGGSGGGRDGNNGAVSACNIQAAKGGSQTAGGVGMFESREANGESLHGGKGGGGGGYFGGGGADGLRGGAGGGSGFVSKKVIEPINQSEEGRIPPARDTHEYRSPAGEGGRGISSCRSPKSHGQPGLVVVKWE